MTESAPRTSIRRRLLVLLLTTVVGTWLAAAAMSYLDARHRVNELLDAHLAQSAALLVAEASHELEEINTEDMPQLHRYVLRVSFQIWERGKMLRLHSANAPQERLSREENGFSDTVVDGKRWRVFSSWDPRHEFLIQVAERSETRDRIAKSVGINLLLPLFVAVPVLGLLIWFSVARGTRPLVTLGNEVARRDPQNLAPFDASGLPAEVAPLVASLNRLFERVRRSIEHERRFTSDAAHELRTPIAALKAQAQVARAATSAAERRRALDMAILGCDHAAHLVDQMLTLARLEPAQALRPDETCDLRAVARDVAAEIAPSALSKQVEIELAEGQPARVAGHAAMLAVLVRNLIDNAVRYSPAGTTVRVGVTTTGADVQLTIIDEGPGVSVTDLARLGQRFFRVPGTDESGSGLGLSIVQRIAELHGASVRFEPGPQAKGLRVSVVLPSARGS